MVIEKVENIIKSCQTFGQLEVASKCVELYLVYHIFEIEKNMRKKVVIDLINLVEWQRIFVK